MADGESESGTAVPGAESRFKNTRQVVRRDARTGVANHNLHVLVLVLGARRGAVNSADREPSAARHEAKRIECQVEQHLLEPMPVGANGDAIEAVDDLHFDARLFGKREEKVVGPVKKLARVGGGKFGLRRVVQVKHVVDGGGKSAQTRLDVFDPAVAFRFEVGLGQEPGEEFEAAEGIAYFVGEQGRHLDQRLLPPELLAIEFELLRLADIAQNKNRRGTGFTLLQPRVADGDPDGFGLM